MTGVDRDKQVVRVILIEGLANVVVLALKGWVGLATGSLAILSDALHSLTDVFNNIVAWIVIRVSGKPPDRDHPYGHRKFEGLAVFVLASLLVVLAVEIAISAVTRSSEPPVLDNLSMLVMGVVLVINIALSAWQRRWAARLDSDILHADASHTFTDVLTTLVVIVGWQLSARGLVWLDTVCALGVAAVVAWLAYGLFRRVIPILVDETAAEPDLLADRLALIDGVIDVGRIRTRRIGQSSSGDVVIIVDPTLSTADSHRIADRVEAVMHDEFAIEDVSVHVEPGLPA